jgi:hypothetical protein
MPSFDPADIDILSCQALIRGRQCGLPIKGTLDNGTPACGIHLNGQRVAKENIAKREQGLDVEEIKTRFLAQVMPEPNSGCHLWTGSTNGHGYGSFYLYGKLPGAHRVAWTLFVGPIPPETPHVLHKCDNPPCVNTDHHFLGTHQDNADDKLAKGRLRFGNHYASRSACKWGHEYTPENTRPGPGNSRRCRICDLNNSRRRDARQKEARRDI